MMTPKRRATIRLACETWKNATDCVYHELAKKIFRNEVTQLLDALDEADEHASGMFREANEESARLRADRDHWKARAEQMEKERDAAVVDLFPDCLCCKKHPGCYIENDLTKYENEHFDSIGRCDRWQWRGLTDTARFTPNAWQNGKDVQRMNEWISVEDRLPDEADIYLVYKNGARSIEYYDHSYREEWEDRKITHWMQLPEPPRT